MARVMLTPKGKSNLDYLFVTDQAVGAASPNRRDDVLLVQFFLRLLSEDLLNDRGTSFNYRDKQGVGFNYTVPNTGPLAIDGVCGHNTIAYIKHFQSEGSKTVGRDDFMSMIVDGVVNPVQNGQPWGARTSHVLSIVRLNTEYRNMYGAARLMGITSDPLFPSELVSSFVMSM